MLKTIKQKINDQQKISEEDAKWLFLKADSEDLKTLATQVKARFHDPKNATYLIMAILNYTNVCVAKCDYCAFYKLPHESGGYLLNDNQIAEKIDAVIKLGGTMVGFNGGFHPKLKIDHYANVFKKVRERYNNVIEFYGMTVAEFMFSAKLSKITYQEAAKYLKNNGSRWITGGGAEILDDGFRMRHSPGKYKVQDYYQAQKAILDEGLGSTATMVIGFDESLDERMNHLRILRSFQDSQKNKLTSFLCWTYKPFNTALGGKEISTSEYLRWLAVCRIYLDNIQHIRTSVLTKNEEALLGLLYGANDFDLPTEDEVTQKAGAQISLDFDRILHAARKLGFNTIKREPWQPHTQTVI